MQRNYITGLPSTRMARLLSMVDAAGRANAINHATPEQQAEAMTRCTPETEEHGRKFEDMKEVEHGA